MKCVSTAGVNYRLIVASRFVCITNIPSPYRIFLFSELSKQLDQVGLTFEVLFMSSSEQGRYWESTLEGAKFQYRVSRGWHLRFRNTYLHLNPGIILRVLSRPPRWLMVGGWHNPTAFITFLAIRVSSPLCRVIMWMEANRDATQFPIGPIAKFREKVLAHVDIFAVPGEIARETISEIAGCRPVRFLSLPNVVDEARFDDMVRRLRPERATFRASFGVHPDALVCLWPARLIENSKGVINFLSSVKDFLGNGVTILIAGDGPDRARICSWLNEHAISSVILLGQLTEDRYLEALACADVLLLPSLRDPNPLSVIEALWAELPLFISKHCGNHRESVIPGENGWVVDPHSGDAMRSAFAELLACDKETLVQMGKMSHMIASRRFATLTCVKEFVSGLTA